MPLLQFLREAQSLESAGQEDNSLDLIYDYIFDLVSQAEFQKIDEIIKAIKADEWSTNILLAILTTTLLCKSKLSYARQELKEETERVLKNRDEYEYGMLLGL